jgi:hypothetical protein
VECFKEAWKKEHKQICQTKPKSPEKGDQFTPPAAEVEADNAPAFQGLPYSRAQVRNILGAMHVNRVNVVTHDEFPYDGITQENFSLIFDNSSAKQRIITRAVELLGKERKAHMEVIGLANNVFNDIRDCLARGAPKISVGNGCCTNQGCPIGVYHGSVVQATKEAIANAAAENKEE